MAWSISSISSSSRVGGWGPRTVFWDAVSGMIVALLVSLIRVPDSSRSRYLGAFSDSQASRMVLWMLIDWFSDPPRMFTSEPVMAALVSPRMDSSRDLPDRPREP
jgi:hypothetical protein